MAPARANSAVISASSPLVLGSASPRRKDILAGLGIPIRVLPAALRESVEAAETPDGYLRRIVRDKLSAVEARCAEQRGAGASELGCAVLVADTIVVLDGEILNKPVDLRDAERLLTRIAGRTHVVKTRYAVARLEAAGLTAKSHASATERTVETQVTMRSASADEIRRYAATGEGLDKAGAYAAQGLGAFLIERISGSYTNVVGLPACELVSDLQALGLLNEFPC